MKKKDLPRTAIMLAGMFLAYKTFDQLTGLIYMILSKNSLGEYNGRMLTNYLLVWVLYLAASFLLIRFSGRLSAVVSRYSFPDAMEKGESIRFTSGEIIRIALIIIGFSFLLQQISQLIQLLYHIRNYSTPKNLTEVFLYGTPPDLPVTLIRFVIALLIIYFAGPMARWSNRISKPDFRTEPTNDTE